jgi:tRNA (Thr-GGU) A37 N-methylase
VVELVAVEGCRLTVRYVDCRDGTPLLDIKPYFPSTDAVPGARVP